MIATKMSFVLFKTSRCKIMVADNQVMDQQTSNNAVNCGQTATSGLFDGRPPKSSSLCRVQPRDDNTVSLSSVTSTNEKYLRVALFSGNYNYTKDGANQALNKLVAYLEALGASVRVYSPTADNPAFEPAGTLISVPSIAIPGRSEYRCSLGMPTSIRHDLETFAPNIIHVSAPDFLCKAAAKFARQRNIPVVASVHTRFENYLKYYKLGWLEKPLKMSINNFYSKCDRVLAPNACMLSILKDEGVRAPIGIWGRGVDQALFNPKKRDMVWRRSLGIADDEHVVLFVGRLVREKGLETFVHAINALERFGTEHRVVVVGDGPGRECFAEHLGSKATFTGFLLGEDLARAYASADVFLNPSLTEAFGNVMLEAMASGLPTVCAKASGSNSLIKHDINGLLVEPDNAEGFANALTKIITDDNIKTRMKEAARELSINFSWPAILQSVVDQYADLCSGSE